MPPPSPPGYLAVGFTSPKPGLPASFRDSSTEGQVFARVIGGRYLSHLCACSQLIGRGFVNSLVFAVDYLASTSIVGLAPVPS